MPEPQLPPYAAAANFSWPSASPVVIIAVPETPPPAYNEAVNPVATFNRPPMAFQGEGPTYSTELTSSLVAMQPKFASIQRDQRSYAVPLRFSRGLPKSTTPASYSIERGESSRPIEVTAEQETRLRTEEENSRGTMIIFFLVVFIIIIVMFFLKSSHAHKS